MGRMAQSWGSEHMPVGQWEFEDGKGEWRRFAPEACLEIENALANGEKSAQVITDAVHPFVQTRGVYVNSNYLNSEF